MIASGGERRNDRAARVDLQSEFNRYLRKQLMKSTKLRIVGMPGGQIQLGTINPDAAAQFVPGRQFYVDFTPADEVQPAA